MSEHLHLRKIGEVHEFKGHPGGGAVKRYMVSDRKSHARNIHEQIDGASSQLDRAVQIQKELGLAKKFRGMSYTVRAGSSSGLDLGDMKQKLWGGLGLLTVPERTPAGFAGKAILYMTPKGLIGLRKNLDEYSRFELGDDHPRRFWLFETMSKFEEVALNDYLSAEQLSLLQKRPLWEVAILEEHARAFGNWAENRGIKLRSLGTQGRGYFFAFEAAPESISEAVADVGGIVRLAPASRFNTTYYKLNPEGKVDHVDKFLASIKASASSAPRTVILDTGVNPHNKLLSASITPAECLTVEETWGIDDHEDHGTRIAGVALFGDIAEQIQSPLPTKLHTRLQSIKVVEPENALYPFEPIVAIPKAIELAEAIEGPKVYCLAATVTSEGDDGVPSPTAAAIDKLAWNDGDDTRLMFIAAGNIPSAESIDSRAYETTAYSERNSAYPISSPGQAFNALCVGGVTFKDQVSSAEKVIAKKGDLCPTSRTSLNWPQFGPLPIKPDICMEGGNLFLDTASNLSRVHRDLSIMTTGNDTEITYVGETSAATAAASGLATRVLAAYPDFRAETVRGLMIHAAEWSEQMKLTASELVSSPKWKRGDHLKARFNCFGWGSPDESFLMRSAANRLTLIIEDNLTAYRLKGTKVALGDMHYHDLPWPVEALRQLGNEEVELRITLSYFIAPAFLEASRNHVQTYASHRFRFYVKRDGEDAWAAMANVNALIDEDAQAESETAMGSDDDWLLGPRRRHKGSVHRDSWTGPARLLAERGGICVYPGRGWAARHEHEAFMDAELSYSLIVSIVSREQDIDLLAEAKIKAPAAKLVTSANIAIVDDL